MFFRVAALGAAGAGALMFVVLVAARLRPRAAAPGLEDGRLRACPASPNCVVSEGGDATHSVAPIPFRGTPEEAMRDLVAAVSGLPRTRVVASRPDYLHAEFRSLVFRFVDDFEARIDAAAKVIQVRSASRSGYSDLGVNRRRVETIRAALEKR